MSLQPNTRLGAYEIVSAIGSGGMGEVYKARDTRLGRDVAIKTLSQSFALDSDRAARFGREAQILASLNHPHIAAIYGLEEANSSQFIVLELVEGGTLADRLKTGPIPFEEAAGIARQIAAALEAAHERGIIHRDLKPANIAFTRDGKVKVLDFGLAKAVESSENLHFSNSPTLSLVATQQGIILGTAAYMSPEQAKGREVDERSDVWAFGCVLYEMLTGRPTFEGADVSEILAGVIKSDPVWTELPENVPPALRVFLRRCLEKDTARRVQDIGDMRLALEGAFDVAVQPAIASDAAPANRGSAFRTAVIAVVCSAVAAAVAGLAVWSGQPREARPVVRFDAFPQGTLFGMSLADPDVALTADGSRIVYQGGPSAESAQLFVRGIDRLDVQPLRGLTSPRNPFISPDGNWVGFFDGSTLKKVAINGGPAVTLCSIKGAPRGASWGPNDIIFATTDTAAGLIRVAAAGGDAQVLTKADADKGELDHLYPEILPGGHAVLFTITPRGGQTLENSQIGLLDLATGKKTVLVHGGTNPHYARSGHIVYAAAGTLRAAPFDLNRLQVSGNPVPVVEHVATKASGAADFALSQNGTLAYISGSGTGGSERTLTWIDRQGHEEPIKVPPRAYAYPRLSPDGTRVALDIRDQENDIWIWDFTRQNLLRLTFDPGFNRGIAWSPDGKRLAFSSQRDGQENIYWQAADGTGTAERLTQSMSTQLPASFAPDGIHILFNQPDAAPYDIGMVNVKDDHKMEMLLHTPFSELNPEVSPDGRWLAYESNESGAAEIYVRPFPDINDGRWQVSAGGGSRPLWARNGKELFYLSGNKLMAVPVQSGTAFSAGNPTALFQSNMLSPFAGRTYDVSPDGKRFLMIKDARAVDPSEPGAQLVVVLNWFDELKRLVPVK